MENRERFIRGWDGGGGVQRLIEKREREMPYFFHFYPLPLYVDISPKKHASIAIHFGISVML